MTPKMLALLVGGLVAGVAGVVAISYAPKVGTTVGELLDAGIVQDYTPRRLGCMVYGPLEDGGTGYTEKQPVVAVAKVANANGTRDVIWSRKAIPFRDRLGDGMSNCRVIATLTWGQVADFDADVPDLAGSCACWRQDAGQNCRQSDGGTTTRNAHNEFQPDDWVGAGCVPKPCGELFGRPNWPEVCPR